MVLILEGGVWLYERVYGDLIFKDMEKNENIWVEFYEVMFNYILIVMKKILKIYNGFNSFSGGVLVDVGGGLGVNFVLIFFRFL